jgi:hypothetical protein
MPPIFGLFSLMRNPDVPYRNIWKRFWCVQF